MNEHSSTPSHSTEITVKKASYANDVLAQMNKYRLQRMFTDAVLSAGQEDFPCHKCVMATSSPYFEALFSSHFEEGLNSRIVFENDFSPWVMKRIIEYVYTGHMVLPLDQAQEYLKIGHMLQYPDIVEACCMLLARHLHPDNCLGIKEFAHLYQCTELEHAAFKYALENFSTVMSSEDFFSVPVGSLIQYLRSDNIEVTNEAMIWNAIVTWVKHDLDNRISHLYDLLKTVRLDCLKKSEWQSIEEHELCQNQLKCVDYLQSVNSQSGGQQIMKDHVNGINGSLSKKCSARPSTLAKDVIVFIGGMNGYVMDSVIAYEPIKQRWITLPSLPESVSWFSVSTYNNNIYVTGGIVNNNLSSHVWKFACRDRQWTSEADLPLPRARHASAVLNGVLYVTGGVTSSDTQGVVPLKVIHARDLNKSNWFFAGSNGSPRVTSTLIAYNNGLLELGGSLGDQYSSTMEAYQMTKSKLIECTGEHFILPCDSPGCMQVAQVDSIVYILWIRTKQLISLNLETRLFKRLFSCSYVHLHGTITHVNNKLYIAGGLLDDKPTTIIECYDIGANEWSTIHLPEERAFHACANVKI